ncbi:MAG: hypothetical protein PHS53_01690 [Candidatus Pacebacteria bacterium]|nr:hypothetical protein [Candidatus Paceibacterota bacterium]
MFVLSASVVAGEEGQVPTTVNVSVTGDPLKNQELVNAEATKRLAETDEALVKQRINAQNWRAAYQGKGKKTEDVPVQKNGECGPCPHPGYVKFQRPEDGSWGWQRPKCPGTPGVDWVWYESKENWIGTWTMKSSDMVQDSKSGKWHAAPQHKAAAPHAEHHEEHHVASGLPPLEPGRFYGTTCGHCGQVVEVGKQCGCHNTRTAVRPVVKETVIVYRDRNVCPHEGWGWIEHKGCWEAPPHPGHYYHTGNRRWEQPPRPYGNNWEWNPRGWWQSPDTSRWGVGFGFQYGGGGHH